MDTTEKGHSVHRGKIKKETNEQLDRFIDNQANK